jgi:hypothetical protein
MFDLIFLVPPVVLPIHPIETSIDDNFPSQHVRFSCRVERGSPENLSLQWLYANNTPVEVKLNTKTLKI